MATELDRKVKVRGRLAFNRYLSTQNENGKFTSALVVEPDEKTLDAIKRLVKDVAEANNISLKGKANPIKKHGEDSEYDYTIDKFVINFNTKYEIPAYNTNREEIDIADLKAGDHVAVVLSAYPWTFNKTKGVGINVAAIALMESCSKEEAFYKKPNASAYFDDEDFEESTPSKKSSEENDEDEW